MEAVAPRAEKTSVNPSTKSRAAYSDRCDRLVATTVGPPEIYPR